MNESTNTKNSVASAENAHTLFVEAPLVDSDGNGLHSVQQTTEKQEGKDAPPGTPPASCSLPQPLPDHWQGTGTGDTEQTPGLNVELEDGVHALPIPAVKEVLDVDQFTPQ